MGYSFFRTSALMGLLVWLVSMLPAPVLGVGTVVSWGYQWGQRLFMTNDLENIASIASTSGDALFMALRADGCVISWGTIKAPPGLTNVAAVAAGDWHGLALKQDGHVVAWGGVWGGAWAGDATNVPPGLSNVVAIAAGGNQSLALKEDGTLAAWGERTNLPPGLTNVIAIAAGSGHDLALRADGTVVAWGEYMPPFPNLTNVVAIAAGMINDTALLADGTVLYWDSNGQIYRPNEATNGVAIAAAGWHGLALKEDGSLVCWGNNDYGQATVPAGLTNILAIATGRNESFVLVGDGSPAISLEPVSRCVYSGQTVRFRGMATGPPPLHFQWQHQGTNVPGATNTVLEIPQVQPGQTGAYRLGVQNAFGSASSREALLRVVEQAPTVIAQPLDQVVFPGGTTSFHVSVEGSQPLACQWSLDAREIPGATNATLIISNVNPSQAGRYQVTLRNSFGVLSSLPASLTLVPVAIWGFEKNCHPCFPGLPGPPPVSVSNALAVAAGWAHAIALRPDGTCVAWGEARFTTNAPAGLTNLVAVAAGGFHSLALNTTGTVVGWGNNFAGQCDAPPTLTNAVAIAAGLYHSLALRDDGTVAAWGIYFLYEDVSYPVFVPDDLTNAVAIAGGWAHSLAVKADGTVTAWGYNSRGQTDVPDSATNVVAVAAGQFHSLALRDDGTVVAWGDNGWGQTDVPPGLTNVVALAANSGCSFAVTSEGAVVGWGYQGDGQMEFPTGLTNVVALSAFHKNVVAFVAGKTTDPLACFGSPTFAAGCFRVTLATRRGRAYGLEYQDALRPGHWTMLPPVPGNGGVQVLSDPQAASKQRFYRVRQR